MTRDQQLTFVQGLTHPVGVSRRYNCPGCHGSATLNVSKPSGEIRWYCFRAGCAVGGSTSRAHTHAELATALDGPGEALEPPRMARPPEWTSPLAHAPAMDWLRRNHCMAALGAGYVSIAFDPVRNRVVFPIHNRLGELVDAAGRALGPGPKWYRYAESGLPFVCRPGLPIAVLVEDCASACAVAAADYSGIAITGTNLLASHIETIRRSETVIVALDPDASAKALAMQRRLSTWLPVRMAMLPDDPKYFSPDELRSFLK